MERRGIETMLGDHNRDAVRRNRSISSERPRDQRGSSEPVKSFGYVANEARLEMKKAIDQKRLAEKTLVAVLAERAKASPAKSLKGLKADILRESKAELRSIRRRIQLAQKKGRQLRKKAKSLQRWVTNPGRMIWIKIAELHQHDRLMNALRTAEAELAVRQAWLESSTGQAWAAQQRYVPERKGARTDERRARRHIRAAERHISQAKRVAELAEGLGSAVYGQAGVTAGISVPEANLSAGQKLATMAQRLSAAQSSLPEGLQAKAAKAIGKGRGISD
jgi:hypothetical protein